MSQNVYEASYYDKHHKKFYEDVTAPDAVAAAKKIESNPNFDHWNIKPKVKRS